MDRENGLSNLLANRMPTLNSLSTNGAGTGANNLNNSALMNAFNFAAGLPLGLWENQLISAMSQYMDVGNPLINLKQESSNFHHTNLKRSENDDNLENKCNKDVLDLKLNNNKRIKTGNQQSNGFVQQNHQTTNQLDQHLNNNKNSSKDSLNFLDNGRSFPCPECHKTFATEVDLKMHLLRHLTQHPFSCSTCGKGFKYEHTLAFHEKTHGIESNNNKLNLKNSNKKSPASSTNVTSSISTNNNHHTHQSNNSSSNNGNNNNHHAHKNDLLSSDEKTALTISRQKNASSKYTFPSSSNKLTHLIDDEDDNNNLPANILASASKFNNSSTSSTNSKPTSQNSSSLFSSNSSSFDFGFPNPAMPNMGIQMKTEKVLIVMVEGVNPLNDQSYTLYKCNICGFAVANLGPVTEHILTAHSNSKAFNCDKCGANFKWKNELLLHDQIHRAMEQASSNSKLIMPSLMQNNLNSLLVNQYLNVSDQVKLDSNNNDNLLSNGNNINNVSPQTSNLANLNGNDSLLGLNLTKAQQRKDSESSQESLSNLNGSTSKGAKNGARSKELKTEELDELSKNIAVVKETISNNELGEIEETAPGQFKCRYCDKTFDRVFSVHRHERVHTGFKPCICKVCGKGFSELRNLRHHLLRFHSDGSGRELLRRVRKDKAMHIEENSEMKRQLKAMEINILSLNGNSIQSNAGSDDDLPLTGNNSINSSSGSIKTTSGEHDDNNSNHSNQSLENLTDNRRSSSSMRRRKSIPYKMSTSTKVDINENATTPKSDVLDQMETEEDDNLSFRSDRTSSIKEDDDSNIGSNNGDHLND